VRPRPQPQPVFRPGGRSWASSGVGAVQAGAGATRSAAQGLALTAQAHPAATLGFRLAGRGFLAAWEPRGGRVRGRRAQHMEAAERLEASTGTAPGGRGTPSRNRAPRAARGRRRRSLQREHGDPPHAERSPAKPPGGAGVIGTSGTGGAQRSRCLPPGPLGGGWVRQGAAAVRARCRAHGGQEAVARQPSSQRGQSSGDASSAAALTGPLQAALPGRTATTNRARATARGRAAEGGNGGGETRRSGRTGQREKSSRHAVDAGVYG
jgi:hypothetical protein